MPTRRKKLLAVAAMFVSSHAGCSAPVPFAGSRDAGRDASTAVDAAQDAAASLVDVGVVDDASAPGDDAGSSCSPACTGTNVCCPVGLPCAGTCVPDCRLGGGSCPGGLACSTSSGVCEPGTGADAGAADAAMDAAMPSPDAAASPDAAMPSPDAGRDAGADAARPTDVGTDASRDAAVCTVGAAPAVGAGVGEATFGQSRWTDLFSGNFVGISGGTAAVGFEGVSGGSSGYVRLYVWDSCAAAWTLQQEVTGSDTTANDLFGSAVSLDGDTLLVGANARPNGAESGMAYVFTRSGTSWTQLQELAPPTAAGQRFGRAVSVSGTTLAIGSPLGKDPTSALTYTGVVSVYTRGAGGRWSYQAHVLGAESAHDDAFGYALDLDAGTLVVGSPGSYVWGASSPIAGKAFVFTGAGTTWTETGYLTPADGAPNDWFGRSVARYGDVVVVGAPRHDVAGIADAGAAYVFTRSGTTWSQTAELTASDGAASDFFGFTVAAPSATRILVGAAGAGRLYAFTSLGGTWTEEPATYTNCGGAIGWALDVDGSGLAISGRPTGTIDLSDPSTSCVP